MRDLFGFLNLGEKDHCANALFKGTLCLTQHSVKAPTGAAWHGLKRLVALVLMQKHGQDKLIRGESCFAGQGAYAGGLAIATGAQGKVEGEFAHDWCLG